MDFLQGVIGFTEMVNHNSPQKNPIGHRLSSDNGRASVLEAATVGVGYQPHDEANAGTSTQIACDPDWLRPAEVARPPPSVGVLRLPCFTIRQIN